MSAGKGFGKGIVDGKEAKTDSPAEWAGKQAGRTLSPAYRAGLARSKQAVANMKARFQK